MGDETSTTVCYKSMYVTIHGIAMGGLSKNLDNETMKKIAFPNLPGYHIHLYIKDSIDMLMVVLNRSG